MDQALLALMQMLLSALQQQQRPPQLSNQQLDQSLVLLLHNLQQNTTSIHQQQHQFQYLIQQQLQLQQLTILQPFMANLHHLQLPPHVMPLCFNPQLQQVNYQQMLSSIQSPTAVQRNNATEIKPKSNKNGFTMVYRSRVCNGNSDVYCFVGEKLIVSPSGREELQPLSDIHFNQMRNDILLLDNTLTVKRTNVKMRETPTSNNQMELVCRRKCENQDQCPVGYYIFRSNGYFGYYRTQNVHHQHVEKVTPKRQKLSSPVRKEIVRGGNPNEIMAQAIIDDKKASHLFGREASSIMNNEQTKSQLLKSMQGFCYRNNYKEKQAIQNSIEDKRRTLEETLQEIKSNHIDLDEIALAKSPQTAYDNHPVVAKHNDKAFACFYTGTDLGENDSGMYSYIKWIRQQSLKIAKNAVAYMNETSRPISLQFDYLHNKFDGDNAVIGQGGITDIWQQYHNTVLDYNKSESTDGSLRMMKDIWYLLCIAGYKPGLHPPIECLIDGSMSLFNAAEQHNIPLCIAEALNVALCNMKYLDDVKKYQIVRSSLMYDFDHGTFYGIDKNIRSMNGNLRSNLFTKKNCYLPLQPSWGYAGTIPGHPKSTQGVESKNNVSKVDTKRFHVASNGAYDELQCIVKATTHTCSSGEVKEFKTIPKPQPSYWKRVFDTSSHSLQEKSFLAYDLNTKCILKKDDLVDLINSDGPLNLHIMVPTAKLMAASIKKLQGDMRTGDSFAELLTQDENWSDEKIDVKVLLRHQDLLRGIFFKKTKEYDLSLYNERTPMLDLVERFGSKPSETKELLNLVSGKKLDASPVDCTTEESELELEKKILEKDLKPSIGETLNETYSRLCGKGLGDFLQVTIKRSEDGTRMVTCSCAKFNVTGSCYEAKKYGCLFLKQYPMNNERFFENVNNADKKKKRELLIKDVKKSYRISVECSFPKDDGTYLHNAPSNDPYYK
ncbi:predicted protein [Chaetoceros tenuissimus]|uniref:Uncharacterized protein n=1 Tax=Chaetoceros tenuissimus TaxID=426638 RepID=A0AAD3H7W9_9STRA|nr:predicted protein [Chaetoceros tenuissimus]